jgi:hypothetical protein
LVKVKGLNDQFTEQIDIITRDKRRLQGIKLLSEIFEPDGKIIITPHLITIHLISTMGCKFTQLSDLTIEFNHLGRKSCQLFSSGRAIVHHRFSEFDIGMNQRVFRNIDIDFDSMTDAPATFAPEAQIKPQSKSKLTLCLVLAHTYIIIIIYALTLTQTRAYTLNYSESKCPGSISRVTIDFV